MPCVVGAENPAALIQGKQRLAHPRIDQQGVDHAHGPRQGDRAPARAAVCAMEDHRPATGKDQPLALRRRGQAGNLGQRRQVASWLPAQPLILAPPDAAAGRQVQSSLILAIRRQEQALRSCHAGRQRAHPAPRSPPVLLNHNWSASAR